MTPNLNLHYEYINKYGILKRDPSAHHDASDLHVSRIIESIVGKDLRKVEKTGNYLIWNGYCWEERDNPTPLLDRLADTVSSHVKQIKSRLVVEKLTLVKEFCEWRNSPVGDVEEITKRIEGFIDTEEMIYKKLSSSTRGKLLEMAASRLFVKPDQLDDNTDKLVFTNGYYDCKIGEFKENDRKQLATLSIRYDYEEPDQESIDRFNNYLNGLELDENGETLEYLQRSFGYAATGRGTEKRFWWFRGITDTSKSTLIQLVAKCLDQYAATTMSSQWCQQRAQSMGHTEDIAKLRARRLVTADEFEKNAKFNESLLKKMTAGTGEISASRKGEKSIDFPITFALFFSSNYDCRLTEDDTAFINRLNTITFKKQISAELKDKQFVTKFLSEGKNKMAVLKWVMEGAKKYCESGINKDPEHVKSSRKELLEGQVSIAEQLQDILEVDSKATGKKAVTLNAVLEALSHLQKATRQHSVFSKQEVSKTIKTVFGVERTSANGHSGFVGLALKKNNEPRSRGYDPRIDHGYDLFDNMQEPDLN